MANKRILTDSVALFNFVGEINDEAIYQETNITQCYSSTNEGVSINSQGSKANDSSKLYIFDSHSVASSPDGSVRTYLPYDDWILLEEKGQYWTLNDKGTDYFKKVDDNNKFKITSFSRKNIGSQRMRHFEVIGK